MATIEPYTEAHEGAVGEFNQRLARGGSAFTFSRTALMDWLPRVDGRRTYMEAFLALERGVVRGGYCIKHQPFALLGAMRDDVCNLQLPLSEGSVDPAYAGISLQLLATAVRKHPLLYALGMGGIGAPLPATLQKMGWTARLVPFFFRVARGGAFLRNIRVLRTTPARRLVLDLAARTGLASAAFRPLHAVLTRPAGPRAEVAVVQRFDGWADTIFERALPAYSMLARRDADELNLLYAADDQRPIRLRVSRGGRDLGWAVVFDTQMTKHKQFGAMRLGSIVDGLALPGEEPAVVRAATRHLGARGVDVIISNQSHSAWRAALKRAGYLQGPSNYGFAISKALAAALAPLDVHGETVHMTRGDGDGPIHI
jgi:hypothetical protein